MEKTINKIGIRADSEAVPDLKIEGNLLDLVLVVPSDDIVLDEDSRCFVYMEGAS